MGLSTEWKERAIQVLAEHEERATTTGTQRAKLNEQLLAQIGKTRELLESDSDETPKITLALMETTALLERAGFGPLQQAGIAVDRQCVENCHRWANELMADCGSDLACIATAQAFRALCVAVCYAYPGHPPLGGVLPPTPGPPEEWPDRPPEWPWPLPWPPIVIHSGGSTGTSTPPPPPPPPTPPLITATQTKVLYNCRKLTIGTLAAGERVTIEAFNNGSFLPGDDPGTIEVLVDGKVAATIPGDNSSTVDGPGKLELHLKGPENRAGVWISSGG